MMSEDIAGQTMSMAQKSAEIAVEIVRLLRQMFERRKERNQLSGQEGSEVPSAPGKGEVSIKEIRDSGYSYSMQTNISAADRKAIVSKAKEYDIPVSFIGKGKGAENITAVFLEQDKELFSQIMQDVMKDKLAVKPNDYLAFNIDNLNSAETLQNMFKINNIPSDIVKSDNGYQCLYEAKNADAVKIIKNDYKEAHDNIKENFQIAEQERKYVISDAAQEKSITLSSLPTKEKLMRVCREQFGFDETKAMEAAHKFESTLSGDKLKYFAAGATGTGTAQDAGYGAVTNRAAGIIQQLPPPLYFRFCLSNKPTIMEMLQSEFHESIILQIIIKCFQ